MHAAFFLETCRKYGIDFYTGVPDSYLNSLCGELSYLYGQDSSSHIIAHNEGGAIGLCAGHFLSTGKPALCYMQNSGLGNAINPLTSLTDFHVYSIPCLLVIGWRGEPGIKDEPQHIKQGAVTLSQLELLGIPYRILSPDTTDDCFLDNFHDLSESMQEGKTAAFVIRKGTFLSDHPYFCQSLYGLSREKAAELILASSQPTDIFVSTTGKLSREIFEIRERRKEKHEKDFLTVGSMGHASMIALRISMEHPDRLVYCLDGDGAAMMHLGAFPLIGTICPRHFIHVVINNGAHESVGGLPVCCGSMNIQALASAAGYQTVCSAATEEELSAKLNFARSASVSGPVLLEIKCSCKSRSDLGRPTVTPVQNRDSFMSFLK